MFEQVQVGGSAQDKAGATNDLAELGAMAEVPPEESLKVSGAHAHPQASLRHEFGHTAAIAWRAFHSKNAVWQTCLADARKSASDDARPPSGSVPGDGLDQWHTPLNSRGASHAEGPTGADGATARRLVAKSKRGMARLLASLLWVGTQRVEIVRRHRVEVTCWWRWAGHKACLEAREPQRWCCRARRWREAWWRHMLRRLAQDRAAWQAVESALIARVLRRSPDRIPPVPQGRHMLDVEELKWNSLRSNYVYSVGIKKSLCLPMPHI